MNRGTLPILARLRSLQAAGVGRHAALHLLGARAFFGGWQHLDVAGRRAGFRDEAELELGRRAQNVLQAARIL